MTVNKNYFDDLSKIEGLSQSELVELMQQFHQGDIMAFNKLIESNLKLVIHYAKQYWKSIKDHKMIEFDDLVSEGNLGLITAIKNYDTTKEIKFAYYSGFWIKKAIIDFIRTNNTNGIRLPESKYTATTKIQKRVDELFQLEQMEITDAYLHLTREFTEREIEHYFSTVQFILPLQSVADSFEDSHEFEALMIKHLNKLKKVEQFVIKMYFGIEQDNTFNLNEIADMLKLTSQRTSQIKIQAINKLKELINTDNAKNL